MTKTKSRRDLKIQETERIQSRQIQRQMLQIIEDAQDHWEHGYHAGNSRFEKSNAHIQEAEQVVRKTVKRPTFYWRQKERIHCKQIQIQIQMFQILEIKIQMLQKLRERMHSRQVYNKSVCNCHEDSELVRMMIIIW